MIEHRWSIACHHAVVDRYTNNVSLLHLIEQITMTGRPEPDGLIPITFDIMTLWERGELDEPETRMSRIVVLNPDGCECELAERSINLTEHQRLRARLTVTGVPFQGFGRYCFRTDIKDGETWLDVGRVCIDVAQGEAKPVQE